MLGTRVMLVLVPILAAIFVAATGVLLLWSNPSRAVNRFVCSCSLNIAAWLGLLFFTLKAQAGTGLYWLRWTCAVSAAAPFQFYLVGEAISENWHQWRRRRLYTEVGGYLAVVLLLMALCFTDYFIPNRSSAMARIRGWGYYAYIVGVSLSYGFVLLRAFSNLRSLVGSKKLEMQVWLFGGCAMAFTIVGAMVLNTYTRRHGYIAFQPIVVLVFYAGTAVAITTRRLFDAGQLLRIILSRTILLLAIGASGYEVFDLCSGHMRPGLAVLPAVGVAVAVFSAVRGVLDHAFNLYGQARVARATLFQLDKEEDRIEKLEPKFLEIIRGWGRTDRAVIWTEDPDSLGANGKAVEGGPNFAALKVLRWATPERLVRDRAAAQYSTLHAFLGGNNLGLVVYSGTPRFNLVVGVGVPASRRPYTYPQVVQLQELAAIIEAAYDRRSLASRIQHAEQLAAVGMLGASVAHEIRNPLVSVKTIVQLLPVRYQEEAFRQKFFGLIGSEVDRIDRMTSQLLNLASPHSYEARPIDLHKAVQSTLELVNPRAHEKRVKVALDLKASPDEAFTDPGAVTQVLLNLCFNAFQALDGRRTEGERRVVISTRNIDSGIELAVTDNGPGLTPQVYAKMFRPFQTTKSSGFGLGLTTCREILLSLNATISVDPPKEGLGATFRITFPCPPSSS